MFTSLRYLNYRIYRVWAASTHWCLRRVSKAGWLVGTAMLVAATLGLDTNLSVAYQAFTFLAVLMIVGLVAAGFNRPRFKARRILPRFGSVGEKLSYRTILQNETRRVQRGLGLIEEMPDPRPTFAEFASTPEPGEEQRNWYDRVNAWYRWRWLLSQNEAARPTEHPVPISPGKGACELRMELVPLKRGVLSLNQFSVLTPDPFGLFHKVHRISAPQSILILPKRYCIPAIPLPGQMKYQQGGVTLSSSVGQSEEFVSLRDYRPGDPLRHIHWRSWARTGTPVVKEFQDEFFVRHALVLDTFSPVAHSQVFEEAVSVAASFACTVQDQDSLLDLMFVGPRAYCFTSGRGVAHIEQLLEILASVKICRDKTFTALSDLVLRHAGALSGCICVFVSWDEDRRTFVERLKTMGVPMLVMVVVEPGQAESVRPSPAVAGQVHVLEAGRVGEDLLKLGSQAA